MRPLPRLHAVTDTVTLARVDLPLRAAAIAAGGSAVALHARDRTASGAVLAAAARRLLALARPPEAALFVNGRADIAAALGAHGVQLSANDLAPADARRVLGTGKGWVGRSVHGVSEAWAAVTEGADFLMFGNVYETGSHPGRPAAGLDVLRSVAGFGVPVIAIGGITPARAGDVRAAGAYGVAAIAALWNAPDSTAATLSLLEPWLEDA